MKKILIGEKLLLRRDAVGYSQQELADKVGCSKATICNLENNKNPCSYPMFRKICDILDVSESYFTGESRIDTAIAVDFDWKDLLEMLNMELDYDRMSHSLLIRQAVERLKEVVSDDKSSGVTVLKGCQTLIGLLLSEFGKKKV
jgi:transcriptional regulator with XRE-family HTH domain